MTFVRRVLEAVDQRLMFIVALIAAFGVFCVGLPILASKLENAGQLVGTIVGAGLTGVFGYVLALQRLTHEERVERRKFRISKLEEAHKVSRSLDVVNVSLFSQVMASLTLDDPGKCIEQIREVSKAYGAPETYSYLKMLVDFYFPELRPQSAEIKKANEAFSEVVSTKMLRAFVSEDRLAKVAVLKELAEKNQAIVEAFRSFQDGLAVVAQELKISSNCE